MSDAIKSGDLVMVFKPTICCGNSSAIGMVGIANAVGMKNLSECSYCGHINKSFGVDILVNGYAFDLVRLKKIDPPALDNEVEHERELESI